MPWRKLPLCVWTIKWKSVGNSKPQTMIFPKTFTALAFSGFRIVSIYSFPCTFLKLFDGQANLRLVKSQPKYTDRKIHNNKKTNWKSWRRKLTLKCKWTFARRHFFWGFSDQCLWIDREGKSFFVRRDGGGSGGHLIFRCVFISDAFVLYVPDCFRSLTKIEIVLVVECINENIES